MLRQILFSLLLATSLTAHADITVGLLTSRASDQTLEDWQPILDDMSASIGQPVHGIVSSDRNLLLDKLRKNEIQVARVDNRLALDAIESAKSEVFARLIQSGNISDFRSVLLVRKESPIQDASNLFDRPQKLVYACGAHGDMAGDLIPQYHLFMKNNQLPERFFRKVINGTNEDAFVALAERRADVAVSNTFDLEALKEKYPRYFSQMRIIWQSPAFSFDPLVMRSDLSATMKQKVERFFVQYGQTGTNTSLAKQRLYYADQLAGFNKADNRTLRQVTDLQLYHDLFRLTMEPGLQPATRQAKEKGYYQRYTQLVNVLGGAR